MNLGLAFKSFFRILGDAGFAGRVRQLLGDDETAPAARRNPALTLVAALQREGRLVDFLKEDLRGYSDEQVGAAVRDVHRDCAAVFERCFAFAPLRAEDEDASVTVAAGFEPSEVRLIGKVTGEPPYRGVLRHAGWRATRCELPSWSGGEAATLVVAPAEVELS
jgi:hypothetical protein